MEVQGKVRLLMEPKTGTSQSTGNTWMSQEVVIDYHWWSNQQEPSQMLLKMFGEDRIKKWNLEVNDEVNIRYHVEAHEYNGRWFNDVRVDGVTFVGASVAKNTPPPSQQTTTTTEAAQQPPNEPQQPQQQNEQNDDLPF